MAGMTSVMLKAWFDAVFKPMAKGWVQNGLPLEELGNVLLGASISVLRGAGWSADQIADLAGRIARSDQS